MKAKKLIAAFMAMAISCGAVHTANYCSPGRFLASAEDESLLWFGGNYDEESKILYLNGKIGAESIRSLRDNPNIHGVQALDGAVLPEDCSYLFSGFSNAAFIDLSKADASNVKTMKGMFSGYNHWGEGYDNVGSINISGLDTSNVTDMSYMFSGSNTVASMEGLDTSNVTDMSYMYRGNMSEYISLSVKYLDTSGVISMKGMFKGNDTNYLDLSNFDTSNVTDMSEMFMGYTLIEYDKRDELGFKGFSAPSLDNLDTSKVKDMSNMFAGSGFTSLDLCSFDTSAVTDMRGMFRDCGYLKVLKAGEKWNTSAVTDSTAMFESCYNLKGGNGTTYDSGHTDKEYARFDSEESPGYLTNVDISGLALTYFDKESGTLTLSRGVIRQEDLRKYYNNEDVKKVVVKKDAVFPDDCSALFKQFKCETFDLSEADTSNVTNMSSMFAYCVNIKQLDLSSFDTSNVTDMSDMFSSCKNIDQIDLSSFDTSNVTNMSSMFLICDNIKQLDLSSFDTSNVTNMHAMFCCSELKQLDLSSFDTSNVTNMHAMFSSCYKLKQLDLSSFDTSNVTNMYAMFCNCSELEQLDLSSFDTSKASSISFNGCSKLTTVLVSDKWNVNKMPDSEGMFILCNNIKGGNGTTYDSKHVDKEYARIDRPGVPGYFTEKEPSSTTDTTTSSTTTTTTTTTTTAQKTNTNTSKTTITETTPITTDTVTTSAATTTLDTAAEADKKLAKQAVVDYQGKTSKQVGSTEIKTTEDGKREITLKDNEGNVLDTYTIDPETGIGTNAAGEAVELPQTGNNSMTNVIIAFGAVMMILFGLAAVLTSGVLENRKKIKK